MINKIISNLPRVKELSNLALLAIKKEKPVLKTTHDNRSFKVKGSDIILDSIVGESIYVFANDCPEFVGIVNEIAELFDNSRYVLMNSFRIMSGDKAEMKIARNLLPKVELEYLSLQMSMEDVINIYKMANTSLPPKYKREDVQFTEALTIRKELEIAIGDKCDSIKESTYNHYKKIVDTIDPNDEITDYIEFMNLARKSIKDNQTIYTAMMFKFRLDTFQRDIDDIYNYMLNTTTNKIYEYAKFRGVENSENVTVKSVKVGAKGFDVLIDVDGLEIYARAIPVNGCFVRFHYRYIVS